MSFSSCQSFGAHDGRACACAFDRFARLRAAVASAERERNWSKGSRSASALKREMREKDLAARSASSLNEHGTDAAAHEMDCGAAGKFRERSARRVRSTNRTT
jgi:hypothetical protein